MPDLPPANPDTVTMLTMLTDGTHRKVLMRQRIDSVSGLPDLLTGPTFQGEGVGEIRTPHGPRQIPFLFDIPAVSVRAAFAGWDAAQMTGWEEVQQSLRTRMLGQIGGAP
jgi:hypothetical protein